MPSTDPTSIDISKSQGITIVWRDGHRSRYELGYLRDRCPCATCTNKPAATTPPSPFPMYKERPKIRDVEMVGHYAFQITWNDGHSTGIYSYVHLREICPCQECAASRAV